MLGGCDEEDGEETPESFVSARLTTRDGAVDFTGAATFRVDDLGRNSCRGTNDDGYGVTVSWAGGLAVLDTPIALSQEVWIKTEAPGMPGVLVDDFFAGELRFTELEMNFSGTFRADPKVEGQEKAIIEVSSGEFTCPTEEVAEAGSG
jgi:hypothetical protein